MSSTDAPRRIVVVNPVDPHPRQVRKGREVLVVRQQLGLEPPHLAGRCPAALDRLAADDPAHRGDHRPSRSASLTSS